MALNDLPAAIQNVIQQGYLERRFQMALRAKLGFRAIADREPFSAGIGESITKTRTGLLPVVSAPMLPAAVGDFTSGMTNQNYGVEQFTLAVAQYAAPMQLNVATAQVAIDDLFLRNAYTLGEQAARSIDSLAQRALYDQYMGGNTRVTITLAAASPNVRVDDVRGFFMTQNTLGQPVAVSAANPLSVLVGQDSYVLASILADGVAPSTIVPWMTGLAFSGASTNTSTTPGGYSGTLTFSSPVSLADGTLGNAVVAATAPQVMRPTSSVTGVAAPTTAQIASANALNAGHLTMQMVLTAKATLSANGVPPVDATGMYHCYADPLQMVGLFSDPAFQQLFRGQEESMEFRKGLVTDLLGVQFIETNLNPVQTAGGFGTIRRAALCGQGALVEGVFTNTAYEAAAQVGDGMITVVDGIAHVTRAPLDVLKQVVSQAWAYIGGFVASTDMTTSPMTVPTASNASFKRALILESF